MDTDSVLAVFEKTSTDRLTITTEGALRPLQNREHVRVPSQMGGHTFGTPTSVVRQDQNRLYAVKLNGTVLRQNQRHLRPSPRDSPKRLDSRSLPTTPPVGGDNNASQPHTQAAPEP